MTRGRDVTNMVQTPTQTASTSTGSGSVLDAQTRERLGRHLQALYEPVLDEALDPRLAALIRQLEADKRETTSR